MIKPNLGIHITDFYGSSKQNYSKTSFKSSLGSRGLDKLGKFLNGRNYLTLMLLTWDH
jgi:hypothetical protein